MVERKLFYLKFKKVKKEKGKITIKGENHGKKFWDRGIGEIDDNRN